MSAIGERGRGRLCLLLAGYGLTGVARALATIAATAGATVAAISSITGMPFIVSAVMVLTAVRSV
jgi:hypothetical protein